jgi:threonyl-tRNA synthetase
MKTPNNDQAELTDEERARYIKKLSKVKMQAPRGNNDLKSNVELGRDLDLFIVNDVVGQGLPLLTPKGATIKREIERFTVDEELKRGYEHTSTPIMAKSDLYKISGHWQHYKDDMFTLNVHGEDFALRPMTCPFQFVLFKRKPRSYKDLPKKYGEISQLFRNEKSGELRGLTRLRQFTLADAHILCTPEQLEEEFKKVMDLVKYIMETFGIEVWYQFSKWDSKNKKGKYIDNPKAWESSQKSMKKILDNMKLKYIEAEDEAAFYGPKLDLQYKDVYGKEDTLITIQIDFALPEKFGLTYLDKDGKEKNVMVIHRSSTGATERVMSYLLEKTQGNLPLWLSPIQAKVMTMNDSVNDYAKKVKDKLFESGIRTELNDSNVSMGKKARNAIMEKVFYLVTVGEKEAKEGKIAVRKRDSRDIETMTVDEFISKVTEEIRIRIRK